MTLTATEGLERIASVKNYSPVFVSFSSREGHILAASNGLFTPQIPGQPHFAWGGTMTSYRKKGNRLEERLKGSPVKGIGFSGLAKYPLLENQGEDRILILHHDGEKHYNFVTVYNITEQGELESVHPHAQVFSHDSHNPALSRNGRYLAVSESSRVAIFDVRKGFKKVLERNIGQYVADLSFSPEGHLAVLDTYDGGKIHVHDVNDDLKELAVISEEEGIGKSLHYLPDGSVVVGRLVKRKFNDMLPKGVLRRTNLLTGKSEVLMEEQEGSGIKDLDVSNDGRYVVTTGYLPFCKSEIALYKLPLVDVSLS